MGDIIVLSRVSAGKSIEVFGKEFTVLEQFEDSAFLLSKAIERVMPFRDECIAIVAKNDFRDCDIHHYLDDEYLYELIDNGANANEDIVKMSIDLQCTLGQREYGECGSKVGLLTLEQYGKYFKIIPKVDYPWWLATPYATPSYCAAFPGYAEYVWSVYTNGFYSFNRYSNTYGIRPAVQLNSSLLVLCNEASN